MFNGTKLLMKFAEITIFVKIIVILLYGSRNSWADKWKKNQLTYAIDYGKRNFTLPQNTLLHISNGTDIITVALHEIGHLLGLEHNSEETSIMFANYGNMWENGRYVKPSLSHSQHTRAIRLSLSDTRVKRSHRWPRALSRSEQPKRISTPRTYKCLQKIDALTPAPGRPYSNTAYIFYGSRVYRSSGNDILKVYMLNELFPGGPKIVTAAVSTSDSLILFKSNEVYRFLYNASHKSFHLEPNYNQFIEFNTTGAMRCLCNREILFSGKRFANYYSSLNKINLIANVTDYLPYFPTSSEPDEFVRGGISRPDGTLIVFTSHEVFAYDEIQPKIISARMKISDYLQCKDNN